jgi:hypothetical protein
MSKVVLLTLAAGFLGVVTENSVTDEAEATAAFFGVVMDQQEKPVANARIDITTAAPKTGPRLFCPSCYADCVKWARTDRQGRFAITDLDPTLNFRLLCTAAGFQTRETPLRDPLAGEVRFLLEPTLAAPPLARTVRAQVVDSEGKPIAGALASVYGARSATRRWWGPVDVQSAVSDAQGHMTLLLSEDLLAIDVTITAAGFAGESFNLLKPGGEFHRLTIPRGAAVRGHVTHQGRPVPKMSVAVVQVDRSSGGHFIKAVGGATGADGGFHFQHLPANQQYAIYSVVGDGSTQGQEFVLGTKTFTVRGDGQTRDLGLLEVTAARTLGGRVRLPGGARLPEDAKIVLGRDPAWDLIVFPIKPDGTFQITGLPPETYEVRVAAQGGWELDAENVKYQVLRRSALGIHLDESITDLAIPLRAQKR